MKNSVKTEFKFIDKGDSAAIELITTVLDEVPGGEPEKCSYTQVHVSGPRNDVLDYFLGVITLKELRERWYMPSRC